MKRKAYVAFLAFCTVSFAFSLDISAGVLGNYVFNDSHITFKFNGGTRSDLKLDSHNNSLGFKAFVDLQFLELSVGSLFEVSDYTRVFQSLNIKSDSLSKRFDSKVQYLTLGAILKSPIPIGIVRLYPLIGFEADIPISVLRVNGEWNKTDMQSIKDLSKYWCEAGLGMDIFLGKKVFLRAEAIFGVDFNMTSSESKILNAVKQSVAKSNPDSSYFALIYKIDACFGFGYKF